MAGNSDQGDKNMETALTGDVSLSGANKDQILAMGGEVDDELDAFKPTAADRGDNVDDATPPPPPAKDEKAEDDDEKAEDDDEPTDEKAEDDDEPTDEKAGKDEPDPEPKKAPKKGDDQRIPKSRFDEVNARRKQAEDELAQLKSQLEAKEKGSQQKFDFDAAEEKYLSLALDGKIKEAMAVRKEIDAAKEAEWEAKSTTKAAATVDAKAVKAELDTLVSEYEGAYPVLNPESDEYSEDIVADALAQYEGYLGKRTDLSPAQAFRLAVNNVVKLYDLKPAGEPEETPTPPVRLKEKKDVKAKLEKAKAAPKDLGKATGDGKPANSDDSLPSIEQMTDEEYDALPESARKRLRGDIF